MFNVGAKNLPSFKQPKKSVFPCAFIIRVAIVLLLHSVKYLSAESNDETTPQEGNTASTVQRALLSDSNYHRRSSGFYNFLALILKDEVNFLCAGTVITSYHILTAAHCMVDNDNNRFAIKRITVKIATRNTATVDKKGLPLNMWFAHPEYESNFRLNDVAVLELSSKLETYSTVALMPLSKKTDVNLLVASKAECTVLGWHPGVTQTATYYVEEKNVSLIAWKDCATSSRMNVSNLLCVEFREQGRCKGDSGGPLLCKNSVQFGVATWDAGCKLTITRHLMMTRVDSVYEFIVKVTQRWRKFTPDDPATKQKKKPGGKDSSPERIHRSDLTGTNGSFFMQENQKSGAESSNRKNWMLTIPTVLMLIMLRNYMVN